jgi:hydrogenase expression/formation protein HypC
LTDLPGKRVKNLCLAVPGKLEKKEGRYGLVDFGGAKRRVDISLLPDCEVGNYIIVHAGFAIEVLEEKDALVTLDIFKQIEAALE